LASVVLDYTSYLYMSSLTSVLVVCHWCVTDSPVTVTSVAVRRALWRLFACDVDGKLVWCRLRPVTGQHLGKDESEQERPQALHWPQPWRHQTKVLFFVNFSIHLFLSLLIERAVRR